jgi:hypothetical protein
MRDDDGERRRRFQRTALALTAGAALFLAGRGVDKALRPGGSDFTVYRDAGRAILEGIDPNEVGQQIYLPVAAIAMIPLGLLPYAAAAVLWQLASFACLVWIAREVALFAAAGLPGAPRGDPFVDGTWLAWVPTGCVLRLVDSNFANGQVNLFTLALVLLAMRAYRRDRDVAAGAWIAAGAAIKIVPGFFAVYFLMRRSWRSFAAAVIVTALLVFVLPAAILGWSTNLRYLGEWWRANPAPYLAGGERLLEERAYLPGQSLAASLYRALAATPATSDPERGATANVVALDPEIVKWIVRAVNLAFVALLGWVVARRPASRASPGFAREVSLVLLTALVIAPLVHKAHMVWAIVPAGVLLASILYGRMARGRRGACASLGVLFVILVNFTSPGVVGRWAATGLLSRNVVLLGILALYAAVLVARLPDDRGGSPLASGP